MNRGASPLHAIDVSRGNARTSPEALTLDTLRAVRSLQLDEATLGRILACDAPGIDSLLAHQRLLSPATAEGERALLLVRLQRALGDVHGSYERADAWLDRHDDTLAARPRQLIDSPDGLQRLVRHVEDRCRDCSLW